MTEVRKGAAQTVKLESKAPQPQDVHLPPVFDRVTVAAMTHHDQKQVEKKGLIWLSYSSTL